MSELVLMGNPRRRRSKKRKARRRSPRRARVVRRRRRRNPESHRMRVIAARRGHRRHRRRNPIYKVHRRRRRRNPIGSDFMNILKVGAYGAVGGLALDVLVAKTSGMLPATLQSGVANYAVKAAGALAIGLVGEKALGPGKGRDIANGTMAIVLHEVARSVITGASPTLASSLGLSGLTSTATGILGNRATGLPRRLPPSPIISGVGMGGFQDPLAYATGVKVPGA